MRFTGKPICYVEIGVWLGKSAEWVAQHVLTHPDSIGIGIDPYLPGHTYGKEVAEAAYREMLERMSKFKNWFSIREKSQLALRGICPIDGSIGAGGFYDRGGYHATLDQAIDLLYIDGAHDAHSVLLDFAYAWPMLKTGSVVIFDDWGIGHRKGPYHVPGGVTAILTAFGRWIKPIHEGPKQYAIEVANYPELGAIC